MQRIWTGLVRRKWVIVAFLALGVLAGLVLALRSRKFASQGMLRIEPDRSSMYQISASQAFGGTSATDEKLSTEVLVLTSRGLFLHVARDLDLANKPDFYPKARSGKQTLDDPITRDNILMLMQRDIQVDHFPKTEAVSIRCTTKSALLSTEIVNTLINDYIENVLEVRFGSTERVSKWLIGQLDELKDQVLRDQEQLVDLQSKLGVLAVDPKSSTYLDAGALEALSQASSQATIQRILAEARYRYLRESDPNLIESEQPTLSNNATGNSLLQALRADQAKAMADYSSLTAQFGANYPAVKDAKARLDTINQQVKTEQDRIVNQAKVAFSAASADEAMTGAALTGHQKDAFKSRDNMVRYAILLREYESHRALYEGLVQRLREAGINSGLQSATIDVVDLAVVPSRAQPPGRLTLIAFASFSMFLLGCIAAVVIDFRDAKFDTQEEAERALGLQCLTMLPLESAAERAIPFTSIEQPTSHYAEAAQMLRNAILMSSPDKRIQTMLVTSAWPGEGKSTTARELAATFAMNGQNVLLIDGDMRKPSQHTMLGLPRSPGLSTVISGGATLEEAIHKMSGVDRMWVLTAGPAPPQSAVLWNSGKMQELMAQCAARFDVVIIDSPPTLSVSDAVLAAAMVDACLLVIRQGFADQRSVQQATTQLRRVNAKIAGFVLNAMSFRWDRYKHYRYYGSYGDEAPRKGKK